jgi:hypothetical protein
MADALTNPFIGKVSLFVCGVGVLLPRVTYFIFPFVTPQTVKLFGLRKGMMAGRIAGFALSGLGARILYVS